jgi:hypothetical protein
MLKIIEIDVSKDLEIGDKDLVEAKNLVRNYFEKNNIYYTTRVDGIFLVKLKDYRCKLRLKLNNFIQEN